MKQRTSHEKSNDQASMIISTEILNSLLIKTKMIMNKKIIEQKNLLRKLLVEKNLNFLQESSCIASIEELMLVAVYYDLPLNIFDNSINLEKMNLLQFFTEFKKRKVHQKEMESEFVLNLWKMITAA